ncbi:ABC transporter B family member 21-like protein [Drosera capensis]
MGTENGMHEPTTPTGSISSLEVEGNSKDVEDERKLKKEETVGRVPFHKLFSFADSTYIVLMFIGSIGAVANDPAYGKEGNATEAEIIAAAELANAHKYISGLQQGYDTVVGERGVQLSGGQKQRSPKILLLDKATSALDAESQRVVQDALDRVMVNRTTVVLAHGLTTIKGAGLIAVVKNGVIVEKGKHKNLLQIQDGVYASLVALHLSASSSS